MGNYWDHVRKRDRALADDSATPKRTERPMVMNVDIGEPQREGTLALCDAIGARGLGRPLPRHAQCWDGQHLVSSLAFARLMAAGRDRGVNPDARGDVIRLALASTDLPHWLGNVGAKVAAESFENASATYKTLFPRLDFRDFRTSSVLNPGEFPTPTKTGEGGEIQQAQVVESGETGRLDTFSSRAAFTFQAMVNDDASMLTRMAESAALRAIDRMESLTWSTIGAESGTGPTLRDGVAFYATARGNLQSSGTAISTASIGVDLARMMRFTGPGGTSGVAAPKFLVCSPENLVLAQTEVAKLALGSDAQMRLTVLATPGIADDSWYLFCDPRQRPAFCYGFIEGSNGPQVSARRHWESDGVEFSLVLDAHVTPVDWRGSHRNAGA